MGLGKGLGCTGTCAKYILFLINFAVFASGAVLLGVGIALLVDSDSIDWINDITGGGDMNDNLFSAAVYMMITIGSLLFLVGFLGCCGACKENTCMLQMYIILVCILLALEITAGILAAVFISEVDEVLEKEMKTSVEMRYGVEATATKAWDAMQHNEKCCGAITFTDYENSTYTQNSSNIIPPSCCTEAKYVGEDITIEDVDYTACKNEAAGHGGGTATLFYPKGCYTTFKEWVEENSALLMGIAFGLGCVQLIGVLFACCIKGAITD